MKQEVFKKGMELAQARGLLNMYVSDVCEACDLPVGSFTATTGYTHGEFYSALLEAGAPLGDAPEGAKINTEVRKMQILNAALSLAEEDSIMRLSMHRIADRCKLNASTVYWHFGNLQRLRDALIKHAVAKACVPVVAQCLVNNMDCPVPSEIREKVSEYLRGL